MAEEVTPADLLEKAADLLAVHGWGQSLYVDEEGRMCAFGALRRADKGTPHYKSDHSEEYRKAARALNTASVKLSGEAIMAWNDEPGRTADEVIDLLKRTAKDLRNKAAAA